MAYVEIYGDQVSDLLAEGQVVGAWHGVAARAVLEGRASMAVTSVADAEKMLREADGNKRRAATAMNERSSRVRFAFLTEIFAQGCHWFPRLLD
jgi:kinesin family protein 5